MGNNKLAGLDRLEDQTEDEVHHTRSQERSLLPQDRGLGGIRDGTINRPRNRLIVTLTASEVSSLADTLTKWEYAEYFFAALVTIACFGEYVAAFKDWFTWGKEKRKKLLEQYSTLLLVGALALELVCLVRTNQLSGKLIGSLSERSEEAVQRSRRALWDSNTAITQSNQATAEARSARETSRAAVDISSKAKGAASTALTLAGDVRKEADSFAKDLAKAKETLKEQSPRGVLINASHFGKDPTIVRFKGQQALIVVCVEGVRDGEKESTMMNLWFELARNGGWTTKYQYMQCDSQGLPVYVRVSIKASDRTREAADALATILLKVLPIPWRWVSPKVGTINSGSTLEPVDPDIIVVQIDRRVGQ